MMNHHTMPKYGFGPLKSGGIGSFYLPKIQSKSSKEPGGTAANNRVSLELSHGNNKQLIALPSDKLDSNKRYYVTFTVKGNEEPKESTTTGNIGGSTNHHNEATPTAAAAKDS